jgi:hypothetical protein
MTLLTLEPAGLQALATHCEGASSGRLTTHATQLNTVADGFAAEDTHDAASLASLAVAR